MNAGPWETLRLNSPTDGREVWRRYDANDAGQPIATVVRNGKQGALWRWCTGRDETFRQGHTPTREESMARCDAALVANGWTVCERVAS